MNAVAQSLSKSKGLRIGLGAALAVIVAVVLYLVFGRSEESVMNQMREVLLSFLRGRGYYERIIIATLFIGLGNAVLIPINIPLLLVALLLPGWPAFIAGLSGAVLASLAGYVYGQMVSSDYLKEKLGEKRYKIITTEIGNNAFKAVVLLSLAPIAPNLVTNILAGLCRIPIWKLVAGTIVGFLPGVIILTLLGRELRAFFEEPGYQAVIWIGAIAALLFLSYKLGRRIQQRLEAEVEA